MIHTLGGTFDSRQNELVVDRHSNLIPRRAIVPVMDMRHDRTKPNSPASEP
jgi:hypothetical protein